MITGIIGDLHEPFTHPEYIKFIKDTFKKWNVEQVVFIGDNHDNHAINFHEHDPDGSAPGDEYSFTLAKMKKWYKEFPKAIWIIGNHDQLPERKIKAAGLPKILLKSLRQLWEVPKDWKIVTSKVINGVYYTHGVGASGQNGALNLAKSMGMPVVKGHDHAMGGVQYAANPRTIIFGLNVGCGIDNESYAFAYGKDFVKKPILGCGIVVDSTEAYFIPMKFPKYRRK